MFFISTTKHVKHVVSHPNIMSYVFALKVKKLL